MIWETNLHRQFSSYTVKSVIDSANRAVTLAHPVRKEADPDSGSIDMGDGMRTGLHYSVVTRQTLYNFAPHIETFVRGELLTHLVQLTGLPLYYYGGEQDLNVNVVEPEAGGYEWHVDSVPFTAILFVTGHVLDGELLYKQGDDVSRVPARSGRMVCGRFDKVPHGVAPCASRRISMPIAYRLRDEKSAVMEKYLYQ